MGWAGSEGRGAVRDPLCEHGKVRASEYCFYSGSVFLALPWKVPRSDAARARGGRAGRGSWKVASSPLFLLRFLWGRGRGRAERRSFPEAGTGWGAVARGRAGRGSRAGVAGWPGRGAEPRGDGDGGCGSRVRIRVPARPRLQGWPSPRSRPSCLTPGSRGTLPPLWVPAFHRALHFKFASPSRRWLY